MFNLFENRRKKKEVSKDKKQFINVEPNVNNYAKITKDLSDAVKEYAKIEEGKNGWLKHFNEIQVYIDEEGDFFHIKIAENKYMYHFKNGIVEFQDDSSTQYNDEIEIIILDVLEKSLDLILKYINQHKKDYTGLIDSLVFDAIESRKLNNTKKASSINSKKVEDKSLIEYPNRYKAGATSLYYAILEMDIAQIKLLLESGADVNKKNDDNISFNNNLLNWYEDRNKTPLYASVKVGNIEIVDLLIKYDADIITLLRFAIEKDKSEISEFLLQKGADPNLFNSLGLACKNQNLKILKLLIDHKADVNYTGDDGRTALFDAIEATKANKEIISYLIQNGTDIHKEDNKGISPLSFAQTNKKSLVEVLTEHEEVILSENQDLKMLTNYEILSNKILLQNKMINKLKDKIQKLSTNKDIEQEKVLDTKFDTFKNDLLKSIKDKENSFTSKIIELEREYRDKYKGQNIFIRALESQLETLEKKLERYKNIKTNESQTDEIEVISRLTSKEKETNRLIQSLLLKVEKLEKKFDKQKISKTKIPLDIHVKNKSIKKDDGVIVKRESFDDF